MRAPKWAGAALAPLVLVSFATAGDYHKDGTLLCSQCHIMHYSQTHGYNINSPTQFFPPPPGGPHEFLLKDNVNDLCLACHDQAGFAPDVLGDINGGNGPTDVRLGGYLNRLGVVGNEFTGHTLDSLNDAPGSNPIWNPQDDNGAGEGLNCINCHHQHGYAGTGNNAYRNLKMDPGNAGFLTALVTYNDDDIGGVPNVTRDVYERQEAEYDEGDMDWMEPDNTSSAIGNFCGGCHDDFSGIPGGANIGGTPDGPSFHEFLRHPVSGVDIGALGGGHSNLDDYNAHTNKVKVMSEVGVWAPVAGADVTPTCISCHKGHGNGNAFGLIYRSGTGTLTEDGDTNGSQVEHLCGQCHVQASFFANP